MIPQSSSLEIFKKICSIPHPSGDTKELAQWICAEIKPYVDRIEQDDAGNIYCKKGNPQICLQAHYDMVLVGEKKPLELQEKEGFLYAKNSSLGADNGAGLALMIAMLKRHEHLECLFSNNEEIGLLGAKGLKIPIKSKYLLNLDSEFFGGITIGCAGGFVLETYLQLKPNYRHYAYNYQIKAQNFLGGHSGIDIIKEIDNPICEIFKILSDKDYSIALLSAGEFNNSIPTKLELEISTDVTLDFLMCLDSCKQGDFVITPSARENKIFYDKQSLQDYILALKHGVWEQDSFGNVTNSLNIAMIRQKKNRFCITLMGRANTNHQLEKNLQQQYDLARQYCNQIKTIEFYLPWEQSSNQDCPFLLNVKEAFLPHHTFVETLHAGLECGVLIQRFKEMGLENIVALSIGPTILHPHSKKEKLDLVSYLDFEQVLDRIVKRYA